MKTLILILLYVLTINIVNSQQIDSLFNEINLVRTNPKNYGLVKNLESERLDTLNVKEPFKLNNSLNYKAQQYSNKLGTLINNSKSTIIYHSNLKYNESICVDYIHNVVYQFIKDYNVADKGHRKHLLSINNTDSKIGIGIYKFTRSDLINQYLVVVITE